ncbi:MAG: 1,4-alpha-glucan branching enzyme, partial [Chthoniobacterales bacterium]|nr:1,4-alpha-glucan branching enzyme [Chthoniobacterales bacterium]
MSNFEVIGMPLEELDAFLSATHPDPFRILGPHRVGENLVVRVFRPDAKEVRIITAGNAEGVPANRLHPNGFFQVALPGLGRDVDYRLHITGWDQSEWTAQDTYRYGTIMGEVDLHLFSEGNHHQIYERFGAHLRNIGGVDGVYFAVWAPNATRVSVVGDFNGWDGRVNPMRRLLGSGVWELFLPEVREGTHYK